MTRSNDQTGKDPVHESWHTNAAWWDETMGDGDLYHTHMIYPALFELLGSVEGQRVLDIGSANGALSRRLSAAGAEVDAFDLVAALVELAEKRGNPGPGVIRYHCLDARDEAALATLGEGVFHAATASMAIHDMDDFLPLTSALRRLLRRDGRLVVTSPHPCFNTSRVVTFVEKSYQGEVREQQGIRVSEYRQPFSDHSMARDGQPTPHPHYHRPLSELLGAFFAAGFILDGLLEPIPSEEERAANPKQWSRVSRVPPIMAFRLRPR